MYKPLLTAALVAMASTAFSQAVFTENFEGTSLPAGWSQETSSTDGGFKVGSSSALQSQYFPLPNPGSNIILTNDDGCNCDKSSDRLYSPSYDLSGLANPFIEASVMFPGLSASGRTETAEWIVSTDGGDSWSTLAPINGDPSGFVTTRVSLADYAGQTDVSVGMSYNDGGGWLYGLGMDYFSILDVAAIGGRAVDVIGTPYSLANSARTAEVRVENLGSNQITSLAGEVTFNGVTTAFDVDGLSIDAFETAVVNTGVSVELPSADEFTVEVSFSMINGVMDADASDNAGALTVVGVIRVPKHPAIAEEATGTWCTWCPRGAVFMERMEEDFEEDFIAIAVHNSDPMAITTYDTGLRGINGFPGFPSVGVSRTSFIDPSELPDVQAQLTEEIVPFEISILSVEIDTIENTLLAEVEVELLSNFTTAMNLAFVTTESGVTGNGSGYAQVNAYAGGSRGAMGGYENLPNPVPASQMVYDFVARSISPSFGGEAVASTTYSAGDKVTRTFEMDVPSNINNVAEVNFIALVLNPQGQLLNGAEKHPTLKGVSSVRNPRLNVSLTAFPNPTVDVLNIRAEFNTVQTANYILSDMAGRQLRNWVETGDVQTTATNVSNLPAGEYQLSIATAEGIRSIGVTVQ